MAFNFMSNAALNQLLTKLKGQFDLKVDKVAGKGLSTNDLTNELKSQYDAAYTHSTQAHAPADAEKNVIIALTVNGSPVTVNPGTRTAAITTFTKVSELQNDSKFQTDTQVSESITAALANYYNKSATDSAIATAVQNAAHLKYQIVEELPTDSISTTTIYMLKKTGGQQSQNVYTEYMYLNDTWEIIGDTAVDVSNFVTMAQVNGAISTALANYVKTTDMVEITTGNVDTAFDLVFPPAG